MTWADYLARFHQQRTDAEQIVQDAHVHLMDEHEGQPSVRSLVAEGYQVITF